MLLFTWENLQTVRENAEIFIKASKDIGLELNSEMTKYMITSRDQNLIQNQNTVIGNLSPENVEKLRYLGVTVTNTNYMREEIKCRINMGNECYYSLEKILSSRLFSNKLKVKTYKTIILPVYCMVVKLGPSPWERSIDYWCSRTKFLGRYLGLRKTKLQDNGESYIIMSYKHFILRLT